jgi:hypothetical protein
MPKEMRINGLGELGSVACLAADMGDTRTGDRFGDAVSRKEPGLQLIELPVAPEQREQIGGEHHQAIALALPWRTWMTMRWESMSGPWS